MPPDDIESLLRAARTERFAPGFADRVATRLADERRAAERGAETGRGVPSLTAARPLSGSLSRQGLRLVPAVLAASLVIGAVNWWHARESDAEYGGAAASPLAGAIGLSRVTVASALTVSGADLSDASSEGASDAQEFR